MLHYTERQLQILEALATFQYLTSKQIIKLQKVTHPHYTNKMIKGLAIGKRPLIMSKGMGIAPVH